MPISFINEIFPFKTPIYDFVVFGALLITADVKFGTFEVASLRPCKRYFLTVSKGASASGSRKVAILYKL